MMTLNKDISKPSVFDYNNRHMLWVRKGFVYFLSLLLLVSLVGGVAALGFNGHLASPHRLEQWLADSKIYDSVVPSVLDQSQKSSDSSEDSSSISLSDPAVQQAAKAAFSSELVQRSANTFLDSNYNWLNGKTTKPEFRIDLSAAKQTFAQLVGQAAETRLQALPICTPAQLAQLPVPADSLSITCRPAMLDPKAENIRITQEVTNNSDFLSNPVITADSLGQDKDSQSSQPYYKKLSHAPTLYRLGLKLPWILGSVALLSAIGILFIAPQRRRGVRRIGIVSMTAGLVLIMVKIVADATVGRFETIAVRGKLASQLKQPIGDFLHRVEPQLVQMDLWFGVGFVVIGLVIFFTLLRTRRGKAPKTSGTPAGSVNTVPARLQADASSIRLAPRRAQPTPDIASARPTPTGPPPLGKNPPRPKRPRLIQ